MLFTVWPQASDGGRFSIYRWAPAIAEFFPGVDEAAARDALGPDGYGILDREAVTDFMTRLRGLLAEAHEGDREGAAQLTGEEIRAIAEEWLRATDPDRHGVHYYEIAHAVERQGAVAGKDPMATVRTVLGRNGKLFDQVGPGTYTWVAAEADARPPPAGRPATGRCGPTRTAAPSCGLRSARAASGRGGAGTRRWTSRSSRSASPPARSSPTGSSKPGATAGCSPRSQTGCGSAT